MSTSGPAAPLPQGLSSLTTTAPWASIAACSAVESTGAPASRTRGPRSGDRLGDRGDRRSGERDVVAPDRAPRKRRAAARLRHLRYAGMPRRSASNRLAAARARIGKRDLALRGRLAPAAGPTAWPASRAARARVRSRRPARRRRCDCSRSNSKIGGKRATHVATNELSQVEKAFVVGVRGARKDDAPRHRASRPVIAASTSCRSRLGKTSASITTSAAGVDVALPRAKTGRKPAARMISTGTDGQESTTEPRSARDPASAANGCLESAGQLGNEFGPIVDRQMIPSARSRSTLGRAVAQPFPVDERVVLADGGRRPQRRPAPIRERDRHAHAR